MNHTEIWDELRTPPPDCVTVDGVVLRVGQRVRLRPRAGGDVMDLALADRIAVVEAIDLTTDGEPHFSVTIDDDPGRDLGAQRYPGHRFFFGAGEIEPLDRSEGSTAATRVLIAGIGNIFFGDDAFGVAVARRLAMSAPTRGVTVRDFGVRGLDLAYALQDGFDAAILVDAMPRGGAAGTLYVIEPVLADDASTPGIAVDAHGLDPVRVLQLARTLGGVPKRILIVGCEPGAVDRSESIDDGFTALSPPVAAAIGEAVRTIDALVAELTSRTAR